MSSSAFSKICSRCGAEYKINVNGSCVRKEECSHHWGRLRRNRGEYVYCVRMRRGRRFCNDRTTASCISVHIQCHVCVSCVVPGGWETLYSCCSGAVGSPGCEVCKVGLILGHLLQQTFLKSKMRYSSKCPLKYVFYL